MSAFKRADSKYIQQRTKGTLSSSGKCFDQMYHMRGNKGCRIKLSPFVTFERAKK